MMDGRVKTLHPKIHGGLLQRRDLKEHQDAAKKHNIPPIDLVVVNLYPFRATVAKGADFETCIENIDIGRPGMIRAAAKNHDFVATVTDPAQYEHVLTELKAQKGATTLNSASSWPPRLTPTRQVTMPPSAAGSPRNWEKNIRKKSLSPPIAARLCATAKIRIRPQPFTSMDNPRPGIANAIQIQGKELSYNNLNDTDAAFELVSEFTDQPAIAIIKHANPCGVAFGPDLLTAYQRALACDPVSAFGGIIACNRPLDGPTAKAIAELFAEVIIAPDCDDAAKNFSHRKRICACC